MTTNKQQQTLNAQRSTLNAQSIRPVAIAREIWRRRIEPVEHVTFEERLAHHIGDYGSFVVSSPTCFAMGLIVQLGNGQRGWFVELAYGMAHDLLKAMPFPLPYIVFQRQPRGPIRVCRLGILRGASGLFEKKENRWAV